MKKKVLITAGPVYGMLDSNKLVSNRARGLWALRFAKYLMTSPTSAEHNFDSPFAVTLLVPDTMSKDFVKRWAFPSMRPLCPSITVVHHNGFEDYRQKCTELAATHDAAVMAAAVVNWIPLSPIQGKMPTAGFKEGDVIQVPFVLAPRVIDSMKAANPKLTLIGCKMTVGATPGELVEIAYDTLLRSKCNVIVANDLDDLRVKHLVYQDRTTEVYDDQFEPLFMGLQAVIEDEHFRTIETPDRTSPLLKTDPMVLHEARAHFHDVVGMYRSRFTTRTGDFVFGAVAVPIPGLGWLVSPREKNREFTSADAVIVTGISMEDRTVTVLKGEGKATLNAPLLVRMLAQSGPHVRALLHLHEQLPHVPTTPYAPPGTVRDSGRHLVRQTFNIQGHGFIASLGSNLEILT